MADNEKTIQHLEMVKEEIRTSNYDTWFSGNKKVRFMGYVDDAIELLKEQEPVKPNKWVPKRQTFTTVRGWYCSNCNFSISYGDRYCRNCGRKIKWDD